MSADVAGLLRGLLLVLRDWGLVAVGLEFLVALPLAVLAWRRPLESWERLTWGVVVSSVPKVLLLSFAAERMFARREGSRAPLNRAAERYLFVVIGNALTAVVVALGAALLCLPAYPLSALLLLTLAWLPSSLEWVVLGVRSTNPALVTDTGPGAGRRNAARGRRQRGRSAVPARGVGCGASVAQRCAGRGPERACLTTPRPPAASSRASLVSRAPLPIAMMVHRRRPPRCSRRCSLRAARPRALPAWVGISERTGAAREALHAFLLFRATASSRLPIDELEGGCAHSS